MSEYPVKPEVAVGAVVFKDGKVLLVKRKFAPSRGFWAIPGGKIKLGETMQQAAEREIFEETGIHIIAEKPIHSFDLIQRDETGKIRFHYVIVDLLAKYAGGELKAGDDVTEAAWFSLDELRRIKLNQSTKQLLHKLLK